MSINRISTTDILNGPHHWDDPVSPLIDRLTHPPMNGAERAQVNRIVASIPEGHKVTTLLELALRFMTESMNGAERVVILRQIVEKYFHGQAEIIDLAAELIGHPGVGLNQDIFCHTLYTLEEIPAEERAIDVHLALEVILKGRDENPVAALSNIIGNLGILNLVKTLSAHSKNTVIQTALERITPGMDANDRISMITNATLTHCLQPVALEEILNSDLDHVHFEEFDPHSYFM